ncbi:hypothetical protein PR048_002989 [Dryococelus australis]|uniref:Reverse transcriptase/retrotransposon-derived protein RNase H-like domain-containing protein n=1 Tax=Dryococelus australis TaxID=614101 RepID=A0ABQ9IN97_9NEOP|nr:hypothetical protein PR048_002989 [Dryococelus australis]
MKPLHNLTKKRAEHCQYIFEVAKHTLTGECVLVHNDPRLPIVVACDATSYANCHRQKNLLATR